MNYYSYPLDSKILLRKKIAIKKELLGQDISWINKKIAVLGGSTTNEIVDQLELALLHYGIKAEFYQSEYGKYWEDAMFGNDDLDNFNPDIIFIHTSWRNIQLFPTISYKDEEVHGLLEKEYSRFESMWEKLRLKFACPIIQNNFDRPGYRLMGNRDIWDCRGKSNFLFSLNGLFYEYARSHESFFINDIDYIAQDFGLSKWQDPVYWNMYKYACPMNAIPYVSFSVANIIKSIFGKNKKLLALDLDNTLWGGVVGDDGVEGIKIGPETPEGQEYYAFQSYCKELSQVGVVLAVNSKNDKENALAGLGHSGGALKEDDFVSIKANWNTKDHNLREISDDLALGLDSFVFADDNPVEREIVRKNLPMVAVPELHETESYIKIFDESGYFELTSLSEEDLSKTGQYKARARAKEEQASYKNYEDYLESLDMKAVITHFEPITIQRVAQLTNKTNQFNLTTLRCSEDDIRRMQDDPMHICLCARLIDKFADNGIVTVFAGEIKEQTLHIKLWLMSCRVLKRSMEDFIMNEVVKMAKDKDIKKIVGYYYPTPKNGMVKDFYKDMGFGLVKSNEDGSSVWEVEVSSCEPRKTAIDKDNSSL